MSRGPNKTTRTVRENFERVFNMLQSEDTFGKARLDLWAMENPTEFYKLCSKLIPTDMNIKGNMIINVVTGVPQAEDEVSEFA